MDISHLVAAALRSSFVEQASEREDWMRLNRRISPLHPAVCRVVRFDARSFNFQPPFHL